MNRPLLTVLAALASPVAALAEAPPSPPPPAPSAATARAVVSVVPQKAHPGELVVLSLPLGPGNACPAGSVGKQAVTFRPLAGRCQALLPLPVEQAEGKLPVRLGKEVAAELTVLPPNFNVRELQVAKKFVAPPKAVKKRMAQDRKAFAKAFAQPYAAPLFDSNFDWPRRDVMTAPFGDLRTFNGKKQSQHYGMDIDGRIGSPIQAANSGVVVMVRDNYAAGQTVMIHHGLDVYTTYFHLSEADVKQGQRVKKGELIGKVGRSGRVTGPHLHFGVKVNGLYVDPASMLRANLFGGEVATASPVDEPARSAPAAPTTPTGAVVEPAAAQ